MAFWHSAKLEPRQRTVTGLMCTVVYVVHCTILGIPFTLRCLNYFCHVPDFNSLLFHTVNSYFLETSLKDSLGLELCPGHNLGITQECVWDTLGPFDLKRVGKNCLPPDNHSCTCHTSWASVKHQNNKLNTQLIVKMRRHSETFHVIYETILPGLYEFQTKSQTIKLQAIRALHMHV